MLTSLKKGDKIRLISCDLSDEVAARPDFWKLSPESRGATIIDPNFHMQNKIYMTLFLDGPVNNQSNGLEQLYFDLKRHDLSCRDVSSIMMIERKLIVDRIVKVELDNRYVPSTAVQNQSVVIPHSPVDTEYSAIDTASPASDLMGVLGVSSSLAHRLLDIYGDVSTAAVMFLDLTPEQVEAMEAVAQEMDDPAPISTTSPFGLMPPPPPPYTPYAMPPAPPAADEEAAQQLIGILDVTAQVAHKILNKYRGDSLEDVIGKYMGLSDRERALLSEERGASMALPPAPLSLTEYDAILSRNRKESAFVEGFMGCEVCGEELHCLPPNTQSTPFLLRVVFISRQFTLSIFFPQTTTGRVGGRRTAAPATSRPQTRSTAAATCSSASTWSAGSAWRARALRLRQTTSSSGG